MDLAMPDYTAIDNLLEHQPIPDKGILTRQLFEDEHVRTVLFTFSKGQCLSEHTASSPAILHFLDGDALVTLGNETMNVHAETWIHMKTGLPHSVKTKSKVVMLLVLIKTERRLPIQERLSDDGRGVAQRLRLGEEIPNTNSGQ